MYDLDESSSEGKVRTDQFERIQRLKENIGVQSVDNQEISSDDDTILLVLSDEEAPRIAELSSSEEKKIVATSSRKLRKTSRTSTASINSTIGSNLIKQQSKGSVKILQDKLMIQENEKNSARKTGSAAIEFNFHSNHLPRKEPTSLSLQEKSQTMSSSILSLSEKKWLSNAVDKPINEFTAKKTGLRADSPSPSLSPRTKEQSELHVGDSQFSNSLPEASKTLASLFPPLHEEKLQGEKASKGWAVKKRSLQADTVSPSISKQTREQSKLDSKTEEEKANWPAKYKKIMATSESSVIIVERLSPSIVAKILNQNIKSSSRVKLPMSVNVFASALEEKQIPEDVISKEELYEKSEKPLTRSSRCVGSANVSGLSEKKKPRLSTDVIPVVSVSSDSDASIFTEDCSAAAGKHDKHSTKTGYSSSNEENEQDSSLECKLPTSRLRRKRVLRKVAAKWDPKTHADQMDTMLQSNSINPKSSDDSDNEEASVNTSKSAAESKKNLAFMAKSKPQIHPKSSDELDNEEKSTIIRKNAAEEVLENENVELICQQNYSSNEDSSPNGKLFKRGRGRPSKKSASNSTVCSDPLMLTVKIDVDAKSEKVLTRRMVYKRAAESETCVVTPPKKRRNLELVQSEDNQHGKISLSIARRGLNSATFSGKIEKSSAVPVASSSTKNTASATLTGIRMECRVLLTRDPAIEALCMAQQADKLNKQMTTANAEDENLAVPATKVSRERKKLVGKSVPLFPLRKLRPRQV